MTMNFCHVLFGQFLRLHHQSHQMLCELVLKTCPLNNRAPLKLCIEILPPPPTACTQILCPPPLFPLPPAVNNEWPLPKIIGLTLP